MKKILVTFISCAVLASFAVSCASSKGAAKEQATDASEPAITAPAEPVDTTNTK